LREEDIETFIQDIIYIFILRGWNETDSTSSYYCYSNTWFWNGPYSQGRGLVLE